MSAADAKSDATSDSNFDLAAAATAAAWARRLARGLAACALVSGLGCSDAAPGCLAVEKSRALDRALARGAPERGAPERRVVAEALAEAECSLGVDALLLLAVAERESELDPVARGPAGGLGLMQVRASTGEAVAKRQGIPWRGEATLLDPARNVRIGAAYLAELHGRFGSWEAALAAYNLGPTRLRRLVKSGQPATSPYARAVLRRRDRLRRNLDK